MDLFVSAVPLLFLLSFSVVSTKYTEDTPCELPDGSEGECHALEHCVDWGTEDKSMRKIVYPKFCSMDVFVPTICCADCRPMENSSLPERLMLEGSGYSVVGGYDADRHDFRHMALLGFGDDPRNADWMCGGAIVSDHYILTAAHCISSPSFGKIKFAALGVLKRADDFNMWQIYNIVDIVPYPDYEPPSKYHDIALLATGSRIRYNAEVAPACVYRHPDLPEVASVTGWGVLGHRKPIADDLQVVYVKRFSDEDCMTKYPQHKHLIKGYDNNTQACYGDIHQLGDTCEADSSGPLQIKSENAKRSRCKHTIAGVTSYGRSCGKVGTPGMYTRVSHYVPWIESLTGRLP